ncbi:hypothetical protein BWZ22_04690 [Seonamhaeicola sp. S2-3]|uniref:hypothetical protein n=1 Tax=Seonamhaeicola sp. S2-3 TaxID=1936081 RepID=UPI0009726C3B|nr:hypothetical protein [Seonamhaeicola sp. S2-3]APY10575.1 hypothetical protein BWZ22_04690 [Seonamhaeicola sp. S2-3]
MDVYKIFKWIYSFEEETEVDIEETFSNSKGTVWLSKNNKGLSFKLDHPHSKLFYKEKSNFIISYGTFKIKIDYFLVKSVKNNIFSKIGLAYIFKSVNFDRDTPKFYRYYSRIDSFFMISFLKGGQRELSINLDEFNFKIYVCSFSPEIQGNFLCVECDSKIEFEVFKNYVNNIIVSIAFFRGEFYKLEEFYFQSNFEGFSKKTEVFYRNSDKRYVFPYPFTKSPNDWECKFREDFVLSEDIEEKWASFINESKFKSFVTLLISRPKIYFSIRVVFDFNSYPSISRISLMFVVFETLCEELNEKTSRVEKQIKQKKAAEVLDKIKDKIGINDFKVLNDIIENIDVKLVNNAVHFEQTLKSLGIKYNNEERNILAKRNDFFHGRIIPNSCPIKNEETFDTLEKKYNYYSLRLYVLVSKILLKKINFEGYLINYPKLFEIDYGVKLNEPYFTEL